MPTPPFLTWSRPLRELEDLDVALEGYEVLIPPNSPSPGVTVAFIVHDGAPIEFLRYEKGGGDV